MADIEAVSEKVKEYADLSKTIKITQEKLKVLNKKKKELYKEVIPKLKTNNIAKCNLPYGTLKVTTSKTKIMPTKVTIKTKFIMFFNTRAREPEFVQAKPEEQSEILYKFLYIDNIEYKEQPAISMVYNKEFKQQCKDLSWEEEDDE
jgi:hypothetical protein